MPRRKWVLGLFWIGFVVLGAEGGRAASGRSTAESLQPSPQKSALCGIALEGCPVVTCPGVCLAGPLPSNPTVTICNCIVVFNDPT